MNALVIANEKRLGSQYRARRSLDTLNFAAEKQHLEAIIRNDSSQGRQLQRVAKENPASYGDMLLQAAAAGISINPALGYAYVIPYGDRATLFISYKGLIHVVSRSTVLRGAPQAVLVRQKDPAFKVWTDETGRHFEHVEFRGDEKARGQITHAYCIAHFRDGGSHIEIMDSFELAQCEAAASSRNSKGGAVWRGPWKGEMCKKSVLRRAWKWWPKDGALEAAIQTMDQLEPAPFDDSGEPEVCVTDDDVLGLRDQCTAAGLDDQQTSRWLVKLAGRYGLTDMHNLPASKLATVREELAGYLQQAASNG